MAAGAALGAHPSPQGSEGVVQASSMGGAGSSGAAADSAAAPWRRQGGLGGGPACAVQPALAAAPALGAQEAPAEPPIDLTSAGEPLLQVGRSGGESDLNAPAVCCAVLRCAMLVLSARWEREGEGRRTLWGAI